MSSSDRSCRRSASSSMARSESPARLWACASPVVDIMHSPAARTISL